MSENAFNENWCRDVTAASIDSIERSFRVIDFCLEKQPEAVKEVLSNLSPEHPLYEVFRKYA